MNAPCLSNFKKCRAACCKLFFIKVDNHFELVRYFRLHGLDVTDDGVITFKIPCQMLDHKTGECKIYETRPQFCKMYPRPFDKPPHNCLFKKNR